MGNGTRGFKIYIYVAKPYFIEYIEEIKLKENNFELCYSSIMNCEKITILMRKKNVYFLSAPSIMANLSWCT